MKSQGTTFYTYAETSAFDNGYECLLYSRSDDIGYLTLEIPHTATTELKNSKMYKVTIEEVTDANEIKKVEVFDKLRGASELPW